MYLAHWVEKPLIQTETNPESQRKHVFPGYGGQWPQEWKRAALGRTGTLTQDR